MSSSQAGYSELAASLASIAIAALFGGPVGATKEALVRSIPFIRSRYDASQGTRGLARDLAAAIDAWASGERIDPGEVVSGMAAATEMVNDVGLSVEDMANLGFDPVRVFEEAARRARQRDPLWDSGGHYAVATRALEVTYRHLVTQVSSKQPILVPVLMALRTDLDAQLARVAASVDTLAASVDAQAGQVGELWQELVAGASLSDVLTYLRIRIDDWDKHLWLPTDKAPSSLERRLRAHPVERSHPGPSDDAQEEFNADDLETAFGNERVLVVLGGPGSGKTWLARRYAREAARAAMERLERGEALAGVEIPIFTTWDTWARNDGEVRGSLVAASFVAAFGHSDLGGRAISNRLRRTLAGSGCRVLAVVDSLDEAADREGQAGRLDSLVSVWDWRVIVTSRPAAWRTARLRPSERERVADLLELRYPDDVDGFVDAWFEGPDERADRVKAEIRDRPELRRSAVVPLLLTFFCILANDDPDAGLPATRRELYQHLIERLIARTWHHNPPGADEMPDLEACLALLRRWAWDAVKDSNTPAGLGNWEETFTPKNSQSPEVARAVKAIAPPDGAGRKRRFIHRTVLEHLVAEHVATLSTREAAKVLLPHLWFDNDWAVAAPAALAAHHGAVPGELLESLLEQAAPLADDLPRREAELAFATLLAAANRELAEDLWDGATPTVEARRGRLVDTVLEALLNAGPWGVSRLVGVLVELGASAEARGRAVEAVLAVLPDAEPREVSRLVGVLVELGASEEERGRAVEGVLAVLPDADPWEVSRLVGVLVELGASAEARGRAVEAVLAVLPNAEPRVVSGLVGVLVELGASEGERDRAAQVVLVALRTADARNAAPLVRTLRRLSPFHLWLAWLKEAPQRP